MLTILSIQNGTNSDIIIAISERQFNAFIFIKTTITETDKHSTE